MTEKEPFYIWLNERAATLGVRATDIAVALGCGISTSYRWMAGHSRPPSKYIAPLAKVLNVSAEEILKRL